MRNRNSRAPFSQVAAGFSLRDNGYMHFRLCAAFFALVSIGMAFDVRVVEEIVAKVNGDIITRGDIERTRQTLDAQLKQEGLTGAALQKTMKEREKDALRDQIDQLLLVQRART